MRLQFYYLCIRIRFVFFLLCSSKHGNNENYCVFFSFCMILLKVLHNPALDFFTKKTSGSLLYQNLPSRSLPLSLNSDLPSPQYGGSYFFPLEGEILSLVGGLSSCSLRIPNFLTLLLWMVSWQT